jgi:hypothetical protein
LINVQITYLVFQGDDDTQPKEVQEIREFESWKEFAATLAAFSVQQSPLRLNPLAIPLSYHVKALTPPLTAEGSGPYTWIIIKRFNVVQQPSAESMQKDQT